MGLDLVKGTVRNNLEAGVIEPAMSKVKIIQVEIVYAAAFILIWYSICNVVSEQFSFSVKQFATEAAITILRIDDMIKLVKDESQGEEQGCN